MTPVLILISALNFTGLSKSKCTSIVDSLITITVTKSIKENKYPMESDLKAIKKWYIKCEKFSKGK